MKILKYITAIIIYSLFFSSSQAMAESPKTAIAVCWLSDSGRYYCDGPTQRTSSSYDTVSEALSLSGCSQGRTVQSNFLTHRSLGRLYAKVYSCNFMLREGSTASYTSNRDVRGWWDGITF